MFFQSRINNNPVVPGVSTPDTGSPTGTGRSSPQPSSTANAYLTGRSAANQMARPRQASLPDMHDMAYLQMPMAGAMGQQGETPSSPEDMMQQFMQNFMQEQLQKTQESTKALFEKDEDEDEDADE